MFIKYFKRFYSRRYEKRGLNGYVYDFSVDYYIIGVNDVINIHKYLMKKHDIKQFFDFLKKYLPNY